MAPPRKDPRVALSGQYPVLCLQRRPTTVYFSVTEHTMQTSARNVFCGNIVSVRKGPLLTEVSLIAQNGFEVVSVITSESFDALAFSAGTPATALVKAPEVLIGKDYQKLRTSIRNNLPGRVTSIHDDGVAVEVMGELEGGTPMCALITAKSVNNLNITVNDCVWFFFNAFSVILATE
jgi:molybdate transport system regulatory protein